MPAAAGVAAGAGLPAGLAVVFLTVACPVAALLNGIFFGAAFFTAAFLTAVFFTAALRAAGLLAGLVFFGCGLAGAFRAAGFAAGFFEAADFATTFFAAALLAGLAALRLALTGVLPALFTVRPFVAAAFGLPALTSFALAEAFPFCFCALAAFELRVVFAISLTVLWPWRPGVIAQVFYTGKPTSGILAATVLPELFRRRE
ncbi:MAG: hypothetical protein KGJ32_04495 [Xanthomonadaceae bacterium]|nr:hypothetical protein [Xanthomonadaceae bacterium]